MRAERLEKELEAQKQENRLIQAALRQTEEQTRLLKAQTERIEKLEKTLAAARRRDIFETKAKLPDDRRRPDADRADPTDAVLPEGFRTLVPVVFACNDEYAPYVGVAIESILKNAAEGSFYRIYVLYDEMCRYHRESLELIKQSNAAVRCIDVSKRVDALREYMHEQTYLTREMYFRLLIPELLSFYDKVIYLDCDVIVRTDLAELLSVDMGTDLVAAAYDHSAGSNVEQRRKLGLNLDEYVNSGVLVINIALWLRENTAESCFRLLRETPREALHCPDQDILNVVCKGRIHMLSQTWNICWFMIYGSCRMEWKESECRIFHYAGALKPWSSPGKAMSGYFWEYARTSRFYEELLTKALL